MQEIIEKIIERLGERKKYLNDNFLMAEKDIEVKEHAFARINELDGAIEIVNQVAEEYEECYKDCGQCEAYDNEKH